MILPSSSPRPRRSLLIAGMLSLIRAIRSSASVLVAQCEHWWFSLTSWHPQSIRPSCRRKCLLTLAGAFVRSLVGERRKYPPKRIEDFQTENLSKNPHIYLRAFLGRVTPYHGEDFAALAVFVGKPPGQPFCLDIYSPIGRHVWSTSGTFRL